MRNWTLGQRELTLERPVSFLKDQHEELCGFIFTCSQAAFKTAAGEFKDSSVVTCVVMVSTQASALHWELMRVSQPGRDGCGLFFGVFLTFTHM